MGGGVKHCIFFAIRGLDEISYPSPGNALTIVPAVKITHERNVPHCSRNQLPLNSFCTLTLMRPHRGFLRRPAHPARATVDRTANRSLW